MTPSVIIVGLFKLIVIIMVVFLAFCIVAWLWDEYWMWITIRDARRFDKLDEEYRIRLDEEDHKENEDKNYLDRIGVCNDY